MNTQIIDGKKISAEIRSDLGKKVAELKENGIELGLAVVLVGSDPASSVYVRNKIKACEEVGIKSLSYYLPEETKESELEELILSLSKDEKVNGILVQLPLPKHINEDKILSLIPVEKDVDGFSAESSGNLMLGKKCLAPCTPNGVIQMLKREKIEIAGKNAVIIGRSNIVGKPMAMLLLQENATVTICHSKTKNLAEVVSNADIVVVAIGRPKFLKPEMVKEGAVVIDVGINRVDGKLCGDVDYDAVAPKCSYITPVPGGVGPMTITMLMYNTISTVTEL